MQFIFWVLLALLFHSYIGYALVMYIIGLFRKQQTIIHTNINCNKVSIIIPAYNEVLVIEQKIKNLLLLNSNQLQIEIIFITDGSTDNSINIINNYPQIKLLHQPIRQGKAVAINRAVQNATHSIIIITDANTLINKDALLYMLPHFNNKNIGGVSGEKRIMAKGAVGISESLYWQYESFMKKTESSIHSVIAGAGELFAFRKELYKPLQENLLIDDFMLSASILQQGYRIVYEEKAIATEPPSTSLLQEANRKVRIGAGAAQAMKILGFFPYKNSALNFQYQTRRVIRWIIGPIALPALLIFNYFIFHQTQSSLFYYFLYIQIVFYCMAALGFLLQLLRINLKLLTIPFYFVFMNMCMLAGIIKYSVVGQSVNWRKAQRQEISHS
ncbi:MAG: glycosyltransferase [Bacteroidetes bacterium]|nr:glycosyltransferase [Bacteroidota bacterium]MBS1648309.1 glycosyltransferase [Bacteroidota bacterium]